MVIKMKRVAELRELTTEQLNNRLKEVENELLIERSKKGTGGRAFNPGKIRNLKKLRAIIKTILNERMGIEKGGE